MRRHATGCDRTRGLPNAVRQGQSPSGSNVKLNLPRMILCRKDNIDQVELKSLDQSGMCGTRETIQSPQESVMAQKISSRSPTELDARIGQLIRQRRLELNLRQEDLARSLGIVPHQLQKYETGENRITASRLIECAHALGVHVAWFYQSAEAGADGPEQGHQLSKDEEELLKIYRGLDTPTREQLISIAQLLPSSQRKIGTRTKRT
jgi:transcriptional regulator with XRE-family HTH domain